MNLTHPFGVAETLKAIGLILAGQAFQARRCSCGMMVCHDNYTCDDPLGVGITEELWIGRLPTGYSGRGLSIRERIAEIRRLL